MKRILRGLLGGLVLVNFYTGFQKHSGGAYLPISGILVEFEGDIRVRYEDQGGGVHFTRPIAESDVVMGNVPNQADHRKIFARVWPT